ncbi:hypothetical protein TcCL_NonESM00867 [Trypanosoma cruzi]|nr:hypothetical protein TcCL_NonESM00867 [Trypanosoma cruzi]
MKLLANNPPHLTSSLCAFYGPFFHDFCGGEIVLNAIFSSTMRIAHTKLEKNCSLRTNPSQSQRTCARYFLLAVVFPQINPMVHIVARRALRLHGVGPFPSTTRLVRALVDAVRPAPTITTP